MGLIEELKKALEDMKKGAEQLMKASRAATLKTSGSPLIKTLKMENAILKRKLGTTENDLRASREECELLQRSGGGYARDSEHLGPAHRFKAPIELEEHESRRLRSWSQVRKAGIGT